jgi:DMSO/TMAO reductase YedYZ molybdopterin-dependent catalytic subunit
MEKTMRVMSEKPLNAETPAERLRTWITANEVFFDRNQGAIPTEPIDLKSWRLAVDGAVQTPLVLDFDRICALPKAIVANTLECSGNSRSLLPEKASGNPWTVGGVGNAVWGGVWLRDVLQEAGLENSARHVAFEGFDKPTGSAGIQFVRSIPLAKALDSTLLAYEMNGAPLPVKHGFPLRALAIGWTGANCIKWLRRVTVLDAPFNGFYMDRVYRVFQKDQAPETGAVVTRMKIKTIITRPLQGESLPSDRISILGAAYAGEAKIKTVEISVDGGNHWQPANLIGPDEPFAWRQWQYIWKAPAPGQYVLMARATDAEGRRQPMTAEWNVLGYGNNGVKEHAVTIQIR